MDEIRDLLRRTAVFHCTPRGGGSETRDFEVVHSASNRIAEAELPDWMPPSLQSVLSEFGAVELFKPAHDVPDGFRLFAPAECDASLEQFLETIEEAADFLEDDDLNDLESAEQWSKQLRPIGEVMASGDLFAIDTLNRTDDGECPIVFLDHEYYFGGWLDPDDTDVVAANAVELLTKVLSDPLPYLASHWTGGDPYRQWFPDSVSFPQ